MGRSKEFINKQIIKHYPTTDSTVLANRLNITVGHLRVKARRLGIKKIKVNDIINGKKKCPHCNLMKSITSFRHDKYQMNQLDYYCKSCRAILNILEQSENSRFSGSLAFGNDKTKNPLILKSNGVKLLKCKCCGVIQEVSENFCVDNKMSTKYRNTCKSCEYLKRRGII